MLLNSIGVISLIYTIWIVDYSKQYTCVHVYTYVYM